MAETTYAIVETGGKQYRAEKGTVLLVDRMSEDEGAKVALRPVMFSCDDKFVGGCSALEKVKVEAEVFEHLRGEKLRVFRYKAKKGYRKRHGHRSALTKLEQGDAVDTAATFGEQPEEEGGEVIDLMEALRQSIASKRGGGKEAAKGDGGKTSDSGSGSGGKKPAAKKPAAKKDDDA